MRSSLHELKSFYLMAATEYFPSRTINTSITSVRSKSNVAFLKLQKRLEEENIDSNRYIGFIFQIANTMPTYNSLSKEDYIQRYLRQYGEIE